MLQEGRTDIIRSCSVESVEFGKLLSDKTADSGEKFAAMKKALSAHSSYAKMVRLFSHVILSSSSDFYFKNSSEVT